MLNKCDFSKKIEQITIKARAYERQKMPLKMLWKELKGACYKFLSSVLPIFRGHK